VTERRLPPGRRLLCRARQRRAAACLCLGAWWRSVQEAETQSDPKVQKQFLELTRRWLLLARGLTDSGPHTGALNGDQRGCSGGRVRRRPTATTRRREATLISTSDGKRIISQLSF
jgi:hypothetical protein